MTHDKGGAELERRNHEIPEDGDGELPLVGAKSGPIQSMRSVVSRLVVFPLLLEVHLLGTDVLVCPEHSEVLNIDTMLLCVFKHRGDPVEEELGAAACLVARIFSPIGI